MKKPAESYAWMVAAWLVLGLGFADDKLMLPFLGGSEGSSTTGANPYYGEALALALAPFLFASGRFKRISRGEWLACAAWWLALALAFLAGLGQGSALRNALSELRFALGPLYYVLLRGLLPKDRRLAALAAGAGFLLWFGKLLLLFILVPEGMYNPNITPVPVPAFEHSLAKAWMLPLFSLALFYYGAPRAAAFLATALLAAFAWLSFLRGLWVAWPAAAGAGALALLATKERKLLLGLATSQIMGFLLGTFALFSALKPLSPDGHFLLQFRIRLLGQALHLLKAESAVVQSPPGVSPVLHYFARGGRLYTSMGHQVDASLADRGFMTKEAKKAFLSSPLLGRGLGHMLRYEPVPGVFRLLPNPHNGYWWILAKAGLLGALAFLGILSAGLWALWQRRREHRVLAWSLSVLALFLLLENLQAGLGSLSAALPLALALALPPDKDGAWKS